MRPIRVRTRDGGSYPVEVRPGIAEPLAACLRRLAPSRIVLVTDATVLRLHGRALVRDLEARGVHIFIVRTLAGERNKDAANVQRIYRGLLTAHCDRESVVLAHGGGIVGDLAGFAAATFYRGLRLVQLPTTLLAQLDSSVGGKTGYNLAEGKNLIGAFHNPVAVFADVRALATLPIRQLRAALAEAIKVGMVWDRRIFRLLEERSAAVLGLEEEVLARLVRLAISAKAAIVSRDEREEGLRRILNFGHTVGHAIEAATGYRRFLHGEAVALGMVAEARLGRALGATPGDLVRRLENLLKQVGLADRMNKILLQAAADRLNYDKKVAGAFIRVYLPRALGSAREVQLPRREAVRLLAGVSA